MAEKTCFLLGVVLYLAVASQAGMIVPRRLLQDSVDAKVTVGLFETDKLSSLNPGISDSPVNEDGFGKDEVGTEVNGLPSDYNNGKPAEGDNTVDKNEPGSEPETLPKDVESDESTLGKQENPNTDESGDADSVQSTAGTDEKEDGDGNDDDDEDEIHNVPDDEVTEEDEEGEEEKHTPGDGNTEPEPNGDEDDDGEDHDDGSNDDTDLHGEAGFLNGASIFDTPYFNIEQIKKYFGTLDRPLGQVFRQTLDEAILLNGTFANTTEEEVEIDGKKYIVQKSVIKGADNQSTIYVEALSSAPAINGSEVIGDTQIKNVTET